MDTSATFSQERYDAIRGFRRTDLGRTSAEEIAKLLFKELESLRKSRLLPYLIASPETGVSFYGGRRTIAFDRLDLRGYAICPVETVVLTPPANYYLSGSREYWGTLSIGYRAASYEAVWMWTKFWYPSPTDHNDASTTKLTELGLAELLRAEPLQGLNQSGSSTYSHYVKAIGHRIDALQRATKQLTGTYFLASDHSRRM